MTKKDHEAISSKLRAARQSVAPLLGKFPIPAGKTTTLCAVCHAEVYRLPGLTLDHDGSRHECKPVSDTLPPGK